MLMEILFHFSKLERIIVRWATAVITCAACLYTPYIFMVILNYAIKGVLNGRARQILEFIIEIGRFTICLVIILFENTPKNVLKIPKS